MDADVMSTLIESGTSLATLVAGGTVTAIKGKIQSLKTEKNVDRIRSEYDEIVTKILQERTDAILLAQTYKTELEKIVINDDDIEHLQKTIERVLEIFITFKTESIDPEDSEAIKKIKTQNESLKAIKELINADTLKTMQLLGFNYKAAIGEPLTDVCAEKIKKLAQKQIKPQNQNKKTR